MPTSPLPPPPELGFGVTWGLELPGIVSFVHVPAVELGLGRSDRLNVESGYSWTSPSQNAILKHVVICNTYERIYKNNKVNS